MKQFVNLLNVLIRILNNIFFLFSSFCFQHFRKNGAHPC